MGDRLRRQLWGVLLLCTVLLGTLAAAPRAWATGVADFPVQAPSAHVVDSADLLSRAASTELDRRLETFGGSDLDARLVTLRRLDYGLSLDALGQGLLERWAPTQQSNQLILLIESQNNSAAVVASQGLEPRLSQELLSSTAISTMMVKSVGPITPACRPMFRMISSIRPRAFISVPIVAASRQGSPAHFAAAMQASPFPATASTTMTSLEIALGLPINFFADIGGDCDDGYIRGLGRVAGANVGFNNGGRAEG